VADETTQNRILELEKGYRTMNADVASLKASLEAVGQRMDENTAAIREYINFGNGVKTGLKILRGIERVAVWVAKVAAACSLLWAVWKFAILEALRVTSEKAK